MKTLNSYVSRLLDKYSKSPLPNKYKFQANRKFFLKSNNNFFLFEPSISTFIHMQRAQLGYNSINNIN